MLRRFFQRVVRSSKSTQQKRQKDRKRTLAFEPMEARQLLTGYIVSPPGPLITSEAGLTATFSFHLPSAPTANVVVNIGTDNPKEGTISAGGSKGAFTFTPQNWNSPQSVTVKGVPDGVPDGNTEYHIRFSTTSADKTYNGQNGILMDLTNLDKGVPAPGLATDAKKTLKTNELGLAASFNFQLKTAPTDSVLVALHTDNANEGEFLVNGSKSEYYFATIQKGHWQDLQNVVVVGIPDYVKDGNKTYHINFATLSNDPLYNGLSGQLVTLSNLDAPKYVAGFSVTMPALTTDEDRTMTGGFAVALKTAPSADVVVHLQSDNPHEGVVTENADIRWNSTNWNIPVKVSVKGVPDGVVDGNQTYNIIYNTTSSDPHYNGLSGIFSKMTNVDSKILIANVVVLGPTKGLVTTESGGTSTFTVNLSYPPAPGTMVAIPISSSNPAAGQPDVSALIFDSSNWDRKITVTVTGHDNGLFDGDTKYQIKIGNAQSDDPVYNGRFATTLFAVNTARTDVGQFDGNYTADINGSLGLFPFSRTGIHLTILDGVITAAGKSVGTVDAQGNVALTYTEPDITANLTGSIQGVKGTNKVNGSGTGTVTTSLSGLPVTGKGKWTASRI